MRCIEVLATMCFVFFKAHGCNTGFCFPIIGPLLLLPLHIGNLLHHLKEAAGKRLACLAELQNALPLVQVLVRASAWWVWMDETNKIEINGPMVGCVFLWVPGSLSKDSKYFLIEESATANPLWKAFTMPELGGGSSFFGGNGGNRGFFAGAPEVASGGAEAAAAEGATSGAEAAAAEGAEPSSPWTLALDLAALRFGFVYGSFFAEAASCKSSPNTSSNIAFQSA
jgi:hypothetical protein